VVFITAEGYLAFYRHGSDISPASGWVYALSEAFTISGALLMPDSPEWSEEATYAGMTISEEKFKERCNFFELELDEFQPDPVAPKLIDYKAGTSIYPYADTQIDIERVLGR
jgi:hypothetical protein